MSSPIPLQKSIRPTKLQPQLYSLLKLLSSSGDYRMIVDKDNNPLCVLAGYQLVKGIDLEKKKKQHDTELIAAMQDYYKDVPDDERELASLCIDDIHD